MIAGMASGVTRYDPSFREKIFVGTCSLTPYGNWKEVWELSLDSSSTSSKIKWFSAAIGFVAACSKKE